MGRGIERLAPSIGTVAGFCGKSVEFVFLETNIRQDSREPDPGAFIGQGGEVCFAYKKDMLC